MKQEDRAALYDWEKQNGRLPEKKGIIYQWEDRLQEVDSKAKHYFIVAGWAIDEVSENCAGGVYVLIDGRTYAAVYGLNREDLSNVFHSLVYYESGFALAVPLSDLGSGRHTVALQIISHDRQKYYQTDPKTIEIK
jgi:hypothetical protein